MKDINKNINEDLLDETNKELQEINLDSLNEDNESSSKKSVDFEELDLDNILSKNK